MQNKGNNLKKEGCLEEGAGEEELDRVVAQVDRKQLKIRELGGSRKIFIRPEHYTVICMRCMKTAAILLVQFTQRGRE